MSIQLYTTGDACFRCKAVKRKLDQLGLAYDEINLLEDRDLAVELRGRGFNEAPVICVSRDGQEDEWSEGFRPDYLASLAS